MSGHGRLESRLQTQERALRRNNLSYPGLVGLASKTDRE